MARIGASWLIGVSILHVGTLIHGRVQHAEAKQDLVRRQVTKFARVVAMEALRGRSVSRTLRGEPTRSSLNGNMISRRQYPWDAQSARDKRQQGRRHESEQHGRNSSVSS